jgi:hypothetical protein
MVFGKSRHKLPEFMAAVTITKNYTVMTAPVGDMAMITGMPDRWRGLLTTADCRLSKSSVLPLNTTIVFLFLGSYPPSRERSLFDPTVAVLVSQPVTARTAR